MTIVRPRLPLIIALAGMLLAAACTRAPTPYQPAHKGFGYAEQQLDETTWRVHFAGNVDTPRETVDNYLLYRAAEVVLAAGYARFAVLEKDVERDVSYYGTTYQPSLGIGLYRGSYYGGAYAPTQLNPVTRYRAFATVRAHEGGAVPANAPLFEAEELVTRLRQLIVRPVPE